MGAGRRGEAEAGGMSSTVERAPRGPFDGVLQIVRYNWTLYLVAIFVCALVVGVVLVIHPPAALAGLLILGAGAALFLLARPLALCLRPLRPVPVGLDSRPRCTGSAACREHPRGP